MEGDSQIAADGANAGTRSAPREPTALIRWIRSVEAGVRESRAQLASLSHEYREPFHALSFELLLQAGAAQRLADLLATLRAVLGDDASSTAPP